MTPLYDAISLERARQIIVEQLKLGGLIFKISVDSSGGKGIIILSPSASEKDIDDALHLSDNLTVQHLISEHASLKALHDESVNTIRVMTLLFDNQVYLLSTICRIGVGHSSVDNVSSGGLCVGVNDDGRLKELAYSRKENRLYSHHPLGYAFKDQTLPASAITEIHQACQKLALRLPFCRLVSWDFTIDKDGSAIFIETNLVRGGIVIHQMCNGPIFGDLTDKVLAYCQKGGK